VLVSYEVHLPRSSTPRGRFDVAFLAVRAPRDVDRVAAEWSAANARPVSADARSIQLLVENLGGCPSGSERLAHTAIFDDGALLQASACRDRGQARDPRPRRRAHLDYDTVPIWTSQAWRPSRAG